MTSEPKDYVVCRVCGRKFRRITHTHLRIHGISIEEYREVYPGIVLVSTMLRQECSKKMKGRPWKEGQHTNVRRRKPIQYKCLKCGKEFSCPDIRIFCSQSCSASYVNKRRDHKNYKKCQLSLYEQYLHKYGPVEAKERWKEFRRKCGVNSLKDVNQVHRYIMRYGMDDGVAQYAIYLARVMNWNHIQSTTTMVERFGEEKANKIQKAVSDRFKKQVGPKNPQYGKPPVWPKAYYVKELGHKVRSTFEEDMGKLLLKKKIPYQYESCIFKVEMDNRIYHYTPDFQLSPTVFIESKGFLFYPNYEKMLKFIEQHPGITLIVVYLAWQEEMYTELGKFSNFRAYSWDGLDEEKIVEEINNAINS